MIKINRPDEVPEVLLNKGKEKTLEHRVEYDNGKRKFKFDNSIYGHETVKESLVKMQHGKCCYCETSSTPPPSFGDIEHFRPKSHYYWLAYDWDNLLFSCERCNRSFKRAEFPLENPDDRAKSHYDDITKERPLLINPALENPEDYMTFNGMMAVAIDGNLKGRRTIKVLGLNANDLLNIREKVYERLRQYYTLILKFKDRVKELEEDFSDLSETLNKAMEDSEPYAAMARAAIESRFQPGAR